LIACGNLDVTGFYIMIEHQFGWERGWW